METRNGDTSFVEAYSQNDRTEDLLIHPVICGFLGDPSGVKIVDYGCGEGELAFKFASQGAEVLGLDIDCGMIESARSRFDHPSLSFEQVYEDEIPEANDSIDAVVSNLVLMMIPSIDKVRKVIEESHRVLKKKGRLIFTITNPSFIDKNFSVYRNIFKNGFNYNEVGQQHQYVLKTEDGNEITHPTFKDYHYRWEDYINAVSDSKLRMTQVREIIVPEDDYPPYVVFFAEK